MLSSPTALYRAFDSDGRLLYIGIATDWGHRWSRHRQRSAFYAQVASLAIEWHPTREAAALAERAAVEGEEPLHNIEHTARDRRPARFQRNKNKLHARSFDHLEHARSLQHYHLAYEAIDALTKVGLKVRGQEGLVELLADMARSVPYGDQCDTCDSVCYPAKVDVRGEMLTAAYACWTCRRTWTCSWAVDAPLWFPE